MRNRVCVWRAPLALCLFVCSSPCVFAQVDAELTAKKRLFPEIGPGLRAVHIDSNGNYYVLASPSPGLVMYSRDGRKLMTMRETSGLSKEALAEAGVADVPVIFGEDCDVDA